MTAPKVYQLTNGTAVRVEEADFDPEAGTVSFTASGFSAFAIADLTGEDPVDEAPEETPVSVSMPAQTFSGETENVVVSVTQSLGQKNTVFSIWMGYTFFTPITSITGGFYSIWQNLINSWQLEQKRKKENNL